MAIDISKGKNRISDTGDTSSKTSEMANAIREICIELTCPNNEFDCKKAFILIKEYVSTHDRILYSELSAYCFNLKNEKESDFHSNLNCLVEYTGSWNYENGLNSLRAKNNMEEIELREKTKRAIIKLFDHVNLACVQLNSLTRSEEEVREAAKQEFSGLKEDITREMSTQLISLVGIFTAIAFLVFGGFDSLLSVFSNIVSEPISKVVMLASLWGLIITNGLFVFLSSVERITQKEAISKLTITSKISQWANLILITVFLMSSWIYIIDDRNLGGQALEFINKHRGGIGVWGVGVIILFFIFGVVFISKRRKD